VSAGLTDVFKLLFGVVFYNDGSDEGFTELVGDFFLLGPQQPLRLYGDAMSAKDARYGYAVACRGV
jgi:hypothetical protein